MKKKKKEEKYEKERKTKIMLLTFLALIKTRVDIIFQKR